MNSLNILSARVIGQTLPQTTSNRHPRRLSDTSKLTGGVGLQAQESEKSEDGAATIVVSTEKKASPDDTESFGAKINTDHEETPLLKDKNPAPSLDPQRSRRRKTTRRLVDALAQSVQCFLSTIAAPGVYLVSCFHDEKGHFSAILPIKKVIKALSRRGGSSSTAQAVGLSGLPDNAGQTTTTRKEKIGGSRKLLRGFERRRSSMDSASSATSDSELELKVDNATRASLRAYKTKSQNTNTAEEGVPTRRSIRIKSYNEDSARRRRQKKSETSTNAGAVSTGNDAYPPPISAATIKSPTSPTSALRMAKYPRAPAPPRPLIPRRQPSYSTIGSPLSSKLGQKTLVIDLDETLIHSLAKGGRMSSGHMVEVKLNATVGYGGTTVGPQHPILYYVHKRPHCDEFLRKVCKWFNLVVFTASVQEYADPVIDWLEQERKYFSGRYYRQHCTFRNGAYIKDLSSVEPDLSKIMILDNSPLSYIFHEDNAIPIEGWINDPTDNDLLHLVPVLEALQYVTDVRALLALRRGELDPSQ